ncbi:MAG: A/G-specific adenine glycosylase [Beijerinckiaceae bacterium]
MCDVDVMGESSAKRPVGAALGILDWYDRHRRALPWRAPPGEKSDPYVVWLAEIMLQQTTVAAVKPYFAAFVARFPDVAALAAAPVEAVMRQWAGLGYYSRARNLHACAEAIVAGYSGEFPKTEAELRRLPGIGPYTAAAIAAIAFEEKVAVVDGNVERVIARLYAIETLMPAAKAEIKAKTALLVPDDRPGDFAQALMDLGATTCTPRRPACGLCPFRASCRAQALGRPEDFPRKTPKLERPKRRGAVFYLRRTDGALLVRTRPPQGLLGGMTEFPGTEWTEAFEAGGTLRAAPVRAAYRKLPAQVKHVFTHFALSLEIFAANVGQETQPAAQCRFVAAADLESEAFPSLMRKVIAVVRESGF